MVINHVSKSWHPILQVEFIYTFCLPVIVLTLDGTASCTSWKKNNRNTTRWWFQIFIMFTSTWGNDPIWRAYFSNGLVQPPTRQPAVGQTSICPSVESPKEPSEANLRVEEWKLGTLLFKCCQMSRWTVPWSDQWWTDQWFFSPYKWGIVGL